MKSEPFGISIRKWHCDYKIELWIYHLMRLGTFEFLHALAHVYLYSLEVETMRIAFAMIDTHSPSHYHRTRPAYNGNTSSLP